VLVAYLAIAYLVMPAWWKRYVHKHPSLDDVPRITHTKAGELIETMKGYHYGAYGYGGYRGGYYRRW
jgi:hypothetical protein